LAARSAERISGRDAPRAHHRRLSRCLARRSARIGDTIDRGANRQAWSATLRLCDRFGLTPYDAAYLELALRRRFPLATLDGELIRAARAENVPLVGAV
jgi:predicted nucleic acid-binding protein